MKKLQVAIRAYNKAFDAKIYAEICLQNDYINVKIHWSNDACNFNFDRSYNSIALAIEALRLATYWKNENIKENQSEYDELQRQELEYGC